MVMERMEGLLLSRPGLFQGWGCNIVSRYFNPFHTVYSLY